MHLVFAANDSDFATRNAWHTDAAQMCTCGRHVVPLAWRAFIQSFKLGLFWLAITFSSACYGESSFYIVTASQLRWQVNLDRAECLSLVPNRANIFHKDFFDNPAIFSILQATWPKKDIFRDNVNCPYVFSFSILSGLTKAVKYQGRPSVISMAVVVCARKPDKTINDKLCSYKNIYFFRQVSSEIAAFEIGVKAFVLPQKSQWIVLKLDSDKLANSP